MVVFSADTDCDCFRMLAHRAFCANAIFRREAADMIRVGRLDSWTPVPLRDSIPEIIWSNFSISICALLRFSRSSCRAFCRFDIVTPSGILIAAQFYRKGSDLRRGLGFQRRHHSFEEANLGE